MEIAGPTDQILAALRGIEGVSSVDHRAAAGRHFYSVRAQTDQDLRDTVSRVVVSNGWSLLGMQSAGMTLEEIFLRLTTQEDL